MTRPEWLSKRAYAYIGDWESDNMKLTDVSEEQVQRAVNRLSHRPRSIPGFSTPHEVFFGVSANYTKQSSKIALEFESTEVATMRDSK